MLFEEINRRLCGHPITNVDITAVLKLILTSYFSSAENITHPQLKNRIYTDSPQTGIIIESSGAFLPTEAEKRPAVLIKRDTWKVDQSGVLGGYEQGSNPANFTRFIQGVHAIICIGKTPGETDLLGDEVFRLFCHITPLLLNYSCLDTFRVLELSPIKPIQEGRSHYQAVVSLFYRFTDKWTIDIVESTPTTTTTESP